MDYSVELSRAWTLAFSSEAAPITPELAQSLNPPDPERLEVILSELTREAAELEAKAKRKRFLCDFLDRLLLKLSRQQLSPTQPSSSSSPVSPLSPITGSLPRVGKASLISPVVPRGTLIRVKDALRQSGLLLDTFDEDEDYIHELTKGEEEEEEEEDGRSSRGTSGSDRERRGIVREPEGDDDSLDDYLVEAFSDHDEPASNLPGREPPALSIPSKPFPYTPPPLSPSDLRDTYVSLDIIRRRKEAAQRPLSTSGASPRPTDRGDPPVPPPKTLHDRLSYREATWEENNDDEDDTYEHLSNLTSVPEAPECAAPRRPKDPRATPSPNVERHGMACASLAEAAVRHLGTHEDDNSSYELLSETSSVYSEQEIDVTGEDRSNAAVAKRLARAGSAKPNDALLKGLRGMSKSRSAQAVTLVDHRSMLANSQGDPRRQELIHILKNEEKHLQILEILAGCQRLFLAHNYPSPKIEVVFKFVPDLRRQQERFVLQMSNRLHNWAANSNTADCFAIMDDYQLVHDYIGNLPTALKTYEELTSERRDIADVIDVISVHGQKVKFIDLMQQPVIWLTKSSENIKRMIQHTPNEHPDFSPLQKLHDKLLSIIRSGTFGSEAKKERAVSIIGGNFTEVASRALVRHSLLVEMSVSGRRKLRHVFLFPDMLVCAKPRPPGSAGSSFEVRWIVPTASAVIYKSTDVQSEELRAKRKTEIESYKDRIKMLRGEIKKEVDKEGLRSSLRKWRPYGRRGVDKLKEQLHKTQALLVLASPNLEFKISSGNDKRHVLLMSSEFERRSWTDAVTSQKTAALHRQPSASSPAPHFSNNEVQLLLEEFKDMVSINRLGSCLLHDGQDGCLSGVLKVKIHRLEGLKEKIDCIVCVEVDSFEHFDLCAKTSPVGGATDLLFDQEFDIELDFSTTVRFIICQMGADPEDRGAYRNIAKLELRLDPDSLSSYREKPHGLPTFDDPSHSLLLTISLSHQAAHQTLSRQPSDRRGALFGVPMDKVVRREARGAAEGTPQVPLIVRACTEELDRRALEEPGIYRISGMTADVQKLRDAFERNVTATSRLLVGYDVHVISGVLKAYLRELPEPLFTVERYRDFMMAFDLSPIDVKREEFLRLANSLPEPNISTARHLLRHFARINRKSDINKMVSGNLGLIFGPTLLSPASSVLPCDILSVTMESFKQSGTLTFLITLTTEGHLFGD